MENNNALTVIVPVYNERVTILDVLNKLQQNLSKIPNATILVVDDGSTDGTRQILELNSDLYDILITIESNTGKGSAIIAALRGISDGAVLIQDADLEYDPAEIPRIWENYSRYGAQFLITSRLTGYGIVRIHYFWHKIGNKLLTLVFNIINNTTFTDIYSGYLIFDRKFLDASKLRINGWGQQAEILTYLVKNVEKIYEIPIPYYGRSYSEGKKIRASAFFSVVFSILITKFRVLKL
jgi:glycosyltransferase involved in cell wall biosynthesis